MLVRSLFSLIVAESAYVLGRGGIQAEKNFVPNSACTIHKNDGWRDRYMQ